MISLAKTQPGKIIYASGGSGSAPHLIGEVFRLKSGAVMAWDLEEDDVRAQVRQWGLLRQGYDTRLATGTIALQQAMMRSSPGPALLR